MGSATCSCPGIFSLSFSNIEVPWTLGLNHHLLTVSQCDLITPLWTNGSPQSLLGHTLVLLCSFCRHHKLSLSRTSLMAFPWPVFLLFSGSPVPYPFLTSPQSESLSQSLPFPPSATCFSLCLFPSGSFVSLFLSVFLSFFFFKILLENRWEGLASKDVCYTSLVTEVWRSEPTQR